MPHSILGSYYRELGNVSWIELLYGSLSEGGYEELFMQSGRNEEAIAEFKRAALRPVQQASDRERLMRTKQYLSELEQ